MRPVSPAALLSELAGLAVSLVPRGALAARLAAGGDRRGRRGRARVRFADELVEPIRLRGHEVVRVRAATSCARRRCATNAAVPTRTASTRTGGTSTGCGREVLDPLAAEGGSGRVRPVRWDAGADRASRQPTSQEAPPGAVIILSGPFLLGRGLPLDLAVHLDLSPAALARRTPRRWPGRCPPTRATPGRSSRRPRPMSWSARRPGPPRRGPALTPPGLLVAPPPGLAVRPTCGAPRTSRSGARLVGSCGWLSPCRRRRSSVTVSTNLGVRRRLAARGRVLGGDLPVAENLDRLAGCRR